MQHSYNLGPSQCDTNFMNFYKLEKYVNVRLKILKKMLFKNSKVQFALYHSAKHLKRYRDHKELLEKIQTKN